MAESALATVGAAASLVQLGDAALRLCRSISSFIGELKDAKDDMRHLRSKLDDTNSLMRNLIAYIREFQDAPSTSKEHEVLPEVVVGAVQHFHDSLRSVRECLPPDLSPSFTQKFCFVFDKKKIRSAISKLEGCKASTSFALNIICSRNNIKLRDGLISLRIDAETIAAEQKTALQISSQQTSQILTEIQDISQQQSQSLRSLEQVDKQISDTTAQLQSLHTMMTTQSIHPQRQRSTQTFTAVDEDTLAKLVRICVMQTVEMVTPDVNRDETSKINDLSTNVASQAHRQGFFDAKEAESSHAPAPEFSIRNRNRARRSNIVRLFQNYKTIRLRWATFNLRVTGWRHRQTESRSSASYFSIEIDFIPRRFVPFGISSSYTNTPNRAGYYNVCPTILTFNIIPDSIPIDRIFEVDEIDTLRRLIMNREVGVRDHTRFGTPLLKLALKFSSAKCFQYLVSGTGVPISTVLSFSNITDSTLVYFSAAAYMSVWRDIPIFRACDCWRAILDTGLFVDSHQRFLPQIWAIIWMYREKRSANQTYPILEYGLQVIQEYKNIGFDIELFAWLKDEVFVNSLYTFLYHEFCLELSFEAGEDPMNAPLKDYDGLRPLECAVSYLDGLPIGNELDWNKLPDALSPRVLVLLIKAGADVFYVNDHPRSITDLALELGVEHLWKAALIECGYDPSEVKAESERRKMVARRLHPAERSGVDTGPMNSTHDLRHRSAARTTSSEMSAVD
ncbi:uncharacterized protein F4807DRAFT_218599 [Annulohypoxylon truncatum]|uniref:uncharacterized protein n=1 Tax=Annulohypoxylon truncatum TaxID=327061 RepID=UPI002008C499|nr:uncharacterized protein F4807DRAFT_218599 [Annulohypoxylon truncatum]KAI1206925.1 hypothetical protein F4807DRAFT_218599 [Annulohypoxylon truncatum]